MKNEIAVTVIVIALFAGAAVGLATSSYRVSTETTTRTVTATASQFCSSPSPLPVLPLPERQGYSWSVNYTGRWNATVVGITGNGTVAFDQCYSYLGAGYVYVPAWTADGGTTLTVTAHKMDGGNATLELAMNGRLKSTSAPYGSVTVETYLPVTTQTQSSTTTGLGS